MIFILNGIVFLTSLFGLFYYDLISFYRFLFFFIFISFFTLINTYIDCTYYVKSHFYIPIFIFGMIASIYMYVNGFSCAFDQNILTTFANTYVISMTLLDTVYINFKTSNNFYISKNDSNFHHISTIIILAFNDHIL